MTLIIVWILLYANSYVDGESCYGAVVRSGTNQTIIDANNETWTIDSDQKIYKNGQLAGLSGGVIVLVYWNSIVYQSNQNHGWWKWINNTWWDENDSILRLNLTAASGCASDIFSDSTSIPITTTAGTEAPPLPYFVPNSCNDSNYVGDSCNISMTPCDVSQPCQNMGNCTDNPGLRSGYSCLCQSGFNGTDCQFNIQACQSDTCLYNGTCVALNDTDFDCNCTQGRTGIHCELLINYCHSVICLNRGVCRPLFLDYTCECLSTSSGRHCESVSTSLLARQYASKSFAYVAIIFLCTSAGYIITLDILTYVFNIDLTAKERDQIRRKRALHKENNRKIQRSRQKTIRLRQTNKLAPSSHPKLPCRSLIRARI